VAAGVAAYVTKPFSVPALVQLTNELLPAP
jgi:CheY-like chemotaxis protein